VRKFKKDNGEIAEQIGNSCWYLIKTSYNTTYQLPIWSLTELNEWTGSNPWVELL
jgi:hypothetical protein